MADNLIMLEIPVDAIWSLAKASSTGKILIPTFDKMKSTGRPGHIEREDVAVDDAELIDVNYCFENRSVRLTIRSKHAERVHTGQYISLAHATLKEVSIASSEGTK